MAVKIFNYPWHISHQAELLKLPNTEWHWLTNNVRPDWNPRYRDRPGHLKYVTEYKEDEYDMALIHVDQASMSRDPQMSHGKNVFTMDVHEVVKDIPKVIINHGTPFWPERVKEDGLYGPEWMSAKMREFKQDHTMICNSHEAKKMWGIKDLQVVTHGIDPDEWYDHPKEVRVFTTMAPAGWDSYYGRMLFTEVKSSLASKYKIPLIHIGQDYHAESFDDYKDFISRGLIFFAPMFASPMPRARTEAQMSGACVVTTKHQDADMYWNCDVEEILDISGRHEFKEAMKELILAGGDWITGFTVPDHPDVIVDLLAVLVDNYEATVKIGQNGKKMAQDKFHVKRFHSEWAKIIKDVTGKEIYE